MCRKVTWAEPAAEVTNAVSGSKQDVRIIIKLKGVIAEAVIPFFLKYLHKRTKIGPIRGDKENKRQINYENSINGY